MAAFIKIVDGYSNHAGVAVHPDGTIFFTDTRKVAGPDGKARYKFQVWRKPPNQPALLFREWEGGGDTISENTIPGPFGYGDVACHPNGSLVYVVTGGLENKDNVCTGYAVEPGVMSPFPVGGADPRVEELEAEIRRLAALVAELEARPANGGMTLTAGEREALRRMSVLFGFG